jgi:hypothetical protein
VELGLPRQLAFSHDVITHDRQARFRQLCIARESIFLSSQWRPFLQARIMSLLVRSFRRLPLNSFPCTRLSLKKSLSSLESPLNGSISSLIAPPPPKMKDFTRHLLNELQLNEHVASTQEEQKLPYD